jgi:serine/threonine-protein kinase
VVLGAPVKYLITDNPVVAAVSVIVVLALAVFLVARIALQKRRSERNAAQVLSLSQDAISLSELPIAFAKVDGYKLVEKYFESAATITYLARDETGYMFMVVIPAPRLFKDAQFLARFREEAENLGALRHPGLANVLKSGLVDAKGQKIPFMVLEFLEGNTLAEYIRQEGPCTFRQAVRLLASLAGAVQTIHGKGLLHRNVKAESIRINASGDTKLLNPTLAPTGELQKMTQVGHAVAGDAQYLAPEQMMGGPEGPQIDLYALGVVGYLMITGKFPFDTANVAMLAVKKMNEDPIPVEAHRPDTPPALNEVINRLINRDQAQRYPSADLLLQALQSIQV